ncbi:unnamed protein product [Adineta ricciae]|uniref:Adenylate kinase n=1 Tax=Adineta ricciae TaxID=249248 RepID=A0A815XD36_ADIRI|nr:unnamed protein product [Adineta ricciae]CAF1555928.1 unnamed protein product [Adineta ricciae]
MTDYQESAISDPRASLQNLSSRQESSFQYGDPIKHQTKNTTVSKDDKSEKSTEIINYQDDAYDTEEADKKFLESKPTCFLILGKPGVGKTLLARKLADDWHAELINIADLITSNIKQKTELGLHARDLLIRGETVPDQMIARMLDIKMRSPEVAHHGYILDGFPLMNESAMKLRDQMASMKNWPLTPDYVINIRIPDGDLINRREGEKIDPLTGALYIKEQYAPTPIEKPDKQPSKDDDEESDADDDDEDEEQIEEEEQVVDEFFTQIEADIVERLVTRPEDMMPDVADSIKVFKDQLLRLLEEYMADLSHSYLIELDGNMSPTILFQQLLERLSAYPIRRAAVVQRFFPPEEEEEEVHHDGDEMGEEGEEDEDGEKPGRAEEAPPADEMDTEELMLSLAGSNVLSNGYKWQRSRWLRVDPVALKQGNRVSGRQEFSVHFMDKIFVLSNKETLKEFQKNPRRYINQARQPCKLFLYGPRVSGIDKLAQDLARKYDATVIDMVAYCQPKVDELRQQYIDKIRNEVQQATIEKLQQQAEIEAAERAARQPTPPEEEEVNDDAEPSNIEDGETITDPNDLDQTEKAQNADAEEEDESQPPKQPSPAPGGVSPTPAVASSSPAPGTPSAASPVPEEVLEDEPIQVEPITAEHPEVKKAVEQAVEEARSASINVPADVVAELMSQAIQKVEQEQREKNSSGPLYGNWIFVNSPFDKETFTLLHEKHIQPDDVVVLQDTNPQLEALQKRWYKANRAEIDKEIREREEREANERRIQEEERKRKLEEMKLLAEQERQERLAERQRRIEAGEILEDDEEEDEDGTDEKEMEQAILEDRNYEPKKEDFIDKIPETILEEDESMGKEGDKDKESNTDLHRGPPSISDVPVDEEVIPPAGVERDTFVQQARADVTRINELMATINNVFNLEPIYIELMKEDGETLKKRDELLQESYDALEKQFKYAVLETDDGEEGADDAEEAEEGENEEEEEGEEEEVDLFKRDRKKHLGDTSIYDPVALFEKNVLVPGKPDFILSYNSKTYRFANDDNRSAFLQTPLKYLPITKPPVLPAIRISIIGPEGAGKTLQARELAIKYDAFHIKFRDRLQELIIGKTKMKIGPEYSESRDEDDAEEEDEQKPDKPTEEPEELTPEEENIKAYLQDGEPLTPEILDKIVKPWWTEEPYRSRGIVLEGFPAAEDEVFYMVENQLVPDIVLELETESKDIVKRILPKRMEQWTKKMQGKKDKRANKKAKRDRDTKKKIDARRLELIQERDKRIEAGEIVEDDEIEQTLADEFPPDEEDLDAGEDEEDANAARGRLTEAIEQQFNDAKDRIEGVKKTFQEEFVPYAAIRASDKPRYVRNRITKKLERFVAVRRNLFERVYPIRAQLAEKLIDVGYLHYSKFGKFCPVSLYNGDCFPPAFGPDKPARTAVYRKYVYFLANDEARNEFIKNPILYTHQPPPKSLVPAKIALVGPPKAGKTTVAKRIVEEIGCVRISLGDAVRYILDKQRHTILGKELHGLLLKGGEISPETAIRCLEMMLMNAKCQTRGYILDGFPLTKKHVELITEKGIIPYKIFELESDVTECTMRAMKDRSDPNRQFPLPDSPEAIANLYAIYQHEISPVRQWYTEEHKNWMIVNGKNNKWIIWDKVAQETANVTKKIQNYIERKSLNKAASIADLCILPKELLERLGEYEHYCPVSLVLYDELVDRSGDTKTDYAAEYRGKYYRMAGPKELQLFLDDPERFAPLEPHKLPPPLSRRPHRRTEAEVKALLSKPVEFGNYCPVTYLNGGKRYECLSLGQPEFAVEYREKLYFLLNEEAREKFMRQPEKYWNLPLPKKLPPPKTSIDVLNLPSLGYLEQTVAQSIIKSLTATGCFKPKFPFLSIKSSALIYMAYHLKAYNTKSSDYLRRKFRRKLYIFEEQCELISYLAEKTTIRYKKPEKRTPEYNIKYETFFALQHNVPTLNWLT